MYMYVHSQFYITLCLEHKGKDSVITRISAERALVCVSTFFVDKNMYFYFVITSATPERINRFRIEHLKNMGANSWRMR